MSKQPIPSDNSATVQPHTDEVNGNPVRPDQALSATHWDRCRDLAQEPQILDRFVTDLEQAGVVGEERAGKILYLVLTSRVLDRPIAAVVKGVSSGGKSWLTSPAKPTIAAHCM